MGLRALNNPASDFEDPFASTGLDAVQAPPITYPTCSGVHNTPTGASHFWDWSYSHDDQVGSVDFDSNSSQMTLNESKSNEFIINISHGSILVFQCHENIV